MISTLDRHQRILIAPLHWGLGHATRCIPIIDHLITLGKDVAIAGDSSSFELLKRRYPDLHSFELPSYNIRYGRSMTLSMLLQGPKLIKTYRQELKATDKIVSQWQPDVIISDNRFGVRHISTHNIYICHQLNILHQNKMVAKFANHLHRRFIYNFNECWVPDFPDHRLSGRLSDDREIKISTSFIGPLTRLKLSLKTPPIIDVLAILSGPEPARTELEKSLVKEFLRSDKKFTLVRGAERNRLENYPDHFSVLDIVDKKLLTTLVENAASIICRSGYSTIMDLENFDRPKFFIPTQGQTEQEYLAELHAKKDNVFIASSKDIMSKYNQTMI